MLTILLLDDNPTDRQLVQQALAGTDHDLLEAQSVEEARDYFLTHHVDVAILSLGLIPDQTMPDVQRALSQVPQVKVLALAPVRGEDGLTTLLRAEALHAHHLLAKPIDPQQLQTILHFTFPSAPDKGAIGGAQEGRARHANRGQLPFSA